MDDWLTILLAFVFFVLPLLEGIFKKSRKGRTPGPHPDAPIDPDDAGIDGDYLPADVAELPSDPREQWSDGWGSWPDEEREEQKEEPVRVWTAESRPAPGQERYTDVAYTAGGLELQELADRLNRIAEVESAPPEPPAAFPELEVVAARQASRQRRRTANRDRVAPLLRDPGSVRQAIILTEVLGPPVGSRH